MSKITKATFKSFLRKNEGKLYFKSKSNFDSMSDCVMPTHGYWHKAVKSDAHNEHTCGIQGVWLVGGGRDYFTEFSQDGYRGIDVYNCCGHFIVAVVE